MPEIPVYSVDSGVPVPDDGTPARERVPLDTMAIGDSILFPNSLRSAVAGLANRLKKYENKKFTIRKQDDENTRVWRVE